MNQQQMEPFREAPCNLVAGPEIIGELLPGVQMTAIIERRHARLSCFVHLHSLP